MRDFGKILVVVTLVVCRLAAFDPRFRKAWFTLLCQAPWRW
jgi:hypothetical protein